MMSHLQSTDGSGAKRSVVQEQQAAGARARALLGLSELQAQVGTKVDALHIPVHGLQDLPLDPSPAVKAS
jgi:hypothetical protein